METEFIEFYHWVKKNLGLDLFSYKEKQLQRRILTIMKNTTATNLADYCQLMKTNPEIKYEFLDYITINVTEFFRNPELFRTFESELVSKIAPQFSSLKIWSAACSIGCEPYSVAMLADKNQLSLTSNKIIATDIDQTILTQAKKGVFKDSHLKNVSDTDLKNYFKNEKDDFYISDEIKRKVHFKKHDLLLDRFEKDCHVIICRNVTIYFKSEARDKIYQQFSESLVPGGLFFTGATETIMNPERFGLKKMGTFMYQKIG